jgi:hypothetical protein
MIAEIECAGDTGTFRSRFADLSVGGMFLELSPGPLAPGAVVTVRFTLPGSIERFAVRSEVRYVHEGMGIGVQFLDLRAADVERIARFIATASTHLRPKSHEHARRGSRVSVNVPVVLRGVSAGGVAFEEPTEIVTLSKNGACVLLKGEVQVGMRVQLSTARGQTFEACVVWVGDASRPQSRGQFGVQSRGIAHTLGFRFP